MEGVEHRYVQAGDLRVHVAEAGSGDPVVLQHGWPQHWYAWRELIGPLSERHRVICPDLRGHGWTDAPPDGYEKEQLAADLLAVLDALELDRVALVAHDWGAFSGFLACLHAPQRFTRFLAMSILHPWPKQERPNPRQLARVWYQGLLSAPVMGRLVVQRLGFVPRVLRSGRAIGRFDEAELAAFGDRFREPARASATVSLYRTFLLRELGPLLRGRYADRRLTVPTRLLVGEQDPVFKDNPMPGFEEHADDMAIDWLPGAGHFLPEEVPDAVLERARAFLG